jgi:two-component system, OmpR family, manganese sensing sensor histidine kinase
LQTSAREIDSAPLALERRLLLSYLTAFAAIFIVAAVALRFVVIGIINQQHAARLEDLARAGLRSILFVDDTFAIDKAEISRAGLLAPDQGLAWFVAGGRLLGTEGLTTTRGIALDTVSLPILSPKTHRQIGTVKASEWNERPRAYIRYLDTGLVVGALLAIVASGAGGLVLTRRAVRPVEQSFQTLREFTANASHELRGPLTAVATSADAALRDAERDPQRDRLRFETIADGAKRMSRLTGDLLLLAGADRSLERELFRVDVAGILDRLAAHYRARFSQANISLTVTTQRPAAVYGNPDQIERIVGNLLENALRYTPAGGEVSVETGHSGHELQIAVRDSGVGIATEHLERIFDRFWRADPVRSPGGAGLGLSIARALARRHGGDVTVTSRYGAGSTFVASIPIRPPLNRVWRDA